MRPDKGDFAYKLILGIFIFAVLLGLAGVIFSARDLGSEKVLFCFSAAWTSFYAVLAYCWTDEERYDRFEYVMTPVVFGLFFLLMLLIAVGGLVVMIPKIAAGEDAAGNCFALLIVEASAGTFAFFTYKSYLEEYVKKIGKKK